MGGFACFCDEHQRVRGLNIERLPKVGKVKIRFSDGRKGRNNPHKALKPTVDVLRLSGLYTASL